MDRFKVTKIGLLNFWLYDEEEYDFYGGKLILRGTNGSGKSVTMQSFIPLILDGNKSPDRLDPFGSKERKIEDYILGDSDSIQKEESTAYLYMETYNEENNQYITIGLGFRGRKGKGTESWGFALKDGARVGKDFFLYKDAANKIPLTKNELKSRLGTINEFTDTIKDYKAMVNRLLFGFGNLDTYDEFIKLLLQLRSNKLSKDYKPTNLVHVLNTVLQPLTEEDLRPLSEAVEQMNKTKEQVELLEKNSKSLKDFLKVYSNYNETILLLKAKNYYQINSSFGEIQGKIKNLSHELEALQSDLDSKKKRILKVTEEIAINTENKKQLDNQDLKQKIESLTEINEEITKLEEKIKEISENIEKNEDEKIDLQNKMNDVTNAIYSLKREMETYSVELKDLAKDGYFDEIIFFVDEMNENLNEKVNFDSIFMSLNSYIQKINVIMALLEKESKILSESEAIRVEFEKLTNAYKILESSINNQEKNFKESIMAWEEDFIQFINNNQQVKLDDVTKKSIFDLMNSYSQENYDEVKKIYADYVRNLTNDCYSQVLKLENKKSLREKDLSILEEEYVKVKEADSIELPSLNEESDKILDENHIVHVPLYKCIEFKSGISEEVKNHIEASLLDLNLLNAKIILASDIEKVNRLDIQILYLTKGDKKKNNLLKYFDVKMDDGLTLSKDYVKKILESISIDKDELMSISENGVARVGILNSIANKKYNQMYIGYLKRMELKAKRLKELEEEIEVLTKEIAHIDSLIHNMQQKIEIIEIEATKIPSNQLICAVLDKLKELQIELSYNDKRQKELESTLVEIDGELKNVREEISNNKKGIYIPLNLQSYKDVSTIVLSIKDILQNLKSTHERYLSKFEIKNSYNERIESILDTVSYIMADKNEKEKSLKIHIANRDTINELLETKEYKDQKERLLEIENNLVTFSVEKEQLLVEIAKLESTVENTSKENDKLVQEKDILERKNSIYKEIFLREYQLGYVYTNEIVDCDKMVKEIIKNGKDKKDISLSISLQNFFSAFNRYKLDLNDYSLKLVTLFNDYNTLDEEEKNIYSENARPDVTTLYQGVKLNLLQLSQKLSDDIEENKYLISKQDRHLFEDILLNTVGDKIRKRIDSSNEWVSKINSIMSNMQQDSALRFKLVWKSISAGTDDEIDTKELVRILKMDPKLLKESDTEKLTNHFRSKLKRAEELYQDSFISFYKIIEEVLDYRNWFTFQLLYERKGMNFKELTDKTFSKFSGGERAKSMYIPLFASCYAKLNLARENSLRLIALDEAFAGVDEDNIREMFGILKFLDIDFVINSQVLWGDYDTIDDLSICELIRPQNSQVVTVERYRWNGQYKEIINDRKEYNKELEES